MFCSNCGKELSDKALICPNCGVGTDLYRKEQAEAKPAINIVNTNTNTNTNRGYHEFVYVPKSKWMAFFLCLFLGFLGAHRFYVGKIGTGLIWLFTCGLGGIGWCIDLLVILFGGFTDKVGQKLV